MKNIKLILAFVLVLVLIMGTASVSAMSSDTDFKYKDAVIQKANEIFPVFESPNEIVCYSEDYEYFASDNPVSTDEATPDYVLVTFYVNMSQDAPLTIIFGNYVMSDTPDTKTPYPFGKCIYVPAENEVYSISEAYSMKLEGIENIFTEAGLGELIGDMDKDRKLTIKDATYIQKCLAGILEFPVDDKAGEVIDYSTFDSALVYISDFNRDGERNIKDATAIQKCIAGLPY